MILLIYLAIILEAANQDSKSTHTDKLGCRHCNHLSLFALETRTPDY